jgi:hypothetical protein
MSVLSRKWEKLMAVELTYVLKLVRIDEGELAPHYLLGYIWANLSEKKKQQISDELTRRASR